MLTCCTSACMTMDYNIFKYRRSQGKIYNAKSTAERTWITTTAMPTHLHISRLSSMKDLRPSSSPVGSSGRSCKCKNLHILNFWNDRDGSKCSYIYARGGRGKKERTFSQWWSTLMNVTKAASSRMNTVMIIKY